MKKSLNHDEQRTLVERLARFPEDLNNYSYEDAVELLELAIGMYPSNAAWHFHLACIYAKSGRQKESLHCIEQALVNGFKDITQITHSPSLISLRSLPEFWTLIESHSKSN